METNGKKIGVIGCGYRIKDILKHLMNLNPSHKIISIYDPSSESIERFKKEFKVSNICKNYEEVINNTDTEWIFIGSINSAHKEQLIASFNAGKNVFCEKPLVVSIQECKEIKEAFEKSHEKNNVKFLISYPLMYTPHYTKIKEFIDNEEIGKIISMEFNETLSFNHGSFIMTDWRKFYKFSGGHLLEKCCHDIAIANWLIKSLPKKVCSFGGLNFFNPENSEIYEKIKNSGIKLEFNEKPTPNPFLPDKDIIDNQIAIIEYENWIRASFHTNCSSGIPERRMYICGSKGTIRADFVKGQIEIKKLDSKDANIIYTDSDKEGHGGGDPKLVEKLSKIMMSDEDKENYSIISTNSMNQAITSAVTCIMIDESRKKGQVVNMDNVWKELDFV